VPDKPRWCWLPSVNSIKLLIFANGHTSLLRPPARHVCCFRWLVVYRGVVDCYVVINCADDNVRPQAARRRQEVGDEGFGYEKRPGHAAETSPDRSRYLCPGIIIRTPLCTVRTAGSARSNGSRRLAM